jgi:aspartyl-tRNA(Asn)/glutamyl-tRNA(Gln) amidotransferase subunit A
MLNTLTIHEILEHLNRGECCSVDVVRSVLDAIHRTDDRIHGYLTLDESDALEQARAADVARGNGVKGRLLGVPIAVKDVLNVKGQPCTCGSKILKGYVSPYDATAIARLRAEGAVFVGRTNMDEFAMGSTTENSAYGITRNPWNLECVPGGSSGGSAAVVAANECVAALGSDTGGSVRQPASFCGCVGLKPTYGRISRYGLTAYASSLDQIGPMTKDVRDTALLLQIMAGVDAADSTTLSVSVPDYQASLTKDLRGVTVGLPKEYFVGGLDPEVERCVQEAIEVCRQLGAKVVEVSLPHTRVAVDTYYIIAPAEASANLSRFDGVRYGYRAAGALDPLDLYKKTRAEGFGPEVKRRIILGTYVLSSGYYDAFYLRAQKVRTLIRRDFEEAFKHCSVILSPVAPTPAYRIGENSADPLQMYLGDVFTVPVNLAGICGLSVPCGMASGKLPVGLQVMGPALGEEAILRTGFAFEQATHWRAQRSGIATENAGSQVQL